MRSRAFCCLLTILLVGWPAQPAKSQITAQKVRDSIDRGVEFLKQKQKKNGSWTGHLGQPGGVTALCTIALLNAGVEPREATVQRALGYLRSLGEPETTYSTALATMAFCAAEPEKDMALIRRNALWLAKTQVKQGPKRGMWTYSDPQRQQGLGDNSNTQFALLGLHEAERAGVSINAETWRLALRHWRESQNPDGSWGYVKGQPARGSMTCAGISSLVIAAGMVHQGNAHVAGDEVQCCQAQSENEHLERGLDWLGRNFSVHSNPGVGPSKMLLLYYLYGVERVGRLTGRRYLGRHDWYREGAEMLVSQQDGFTGHWSGSGQGENNPLVATSFSLLFLSKGRRPILLAKLSHGPGEDWNHHRGDVANLTRYVERRWKKDLTWQVIDPRAAKTEDLLGAPVLFINGSEGLDFSPAVKKNLREYVNLGGFIFAEACCDDSQRFDRQFRTLMSELFPDSPLRLLPPDHPVWYAEQPVDPKYTRPLYGIDACCRTSVVYCPEKLSCFWELSRGGRDVEYPAAIQAEIDACNAIGANILAYATARQLKDKLELPAVVARDEDGPSTNRGTLYVAKLLHGGGSDDAPMALANLLSVVGQQVKIRVSSQKRLLAISDPKLAGYPICFLHGRRAFRLTDPERKALAEYIQRGGFLFADAICANRQFAESFYREMKTIFPKIAMKRIPIDDPLLTTEYRGFDLRTVSLQDPQPRLQRGPLETKTYRVPPLLEAIEIDGRYAVIFSPYDISCALQNSPSLQCKGYTRSDAAKIGVNVILYALQQ